MWAKQHAWNRLIQSISRIIYNISRKKRQKVQNDGILTVSFCHQFQTLLDLKREKLSLDIWSNKWIMLPDNALPFANHCRDSGEPGLVVIGLLARCKSAACVVLEVKSLVKPTSISSFSCMKSVCSRREEGWTTLNSQRAEKEGQSGGNHSSRGTNSNTASSRFSVTT